MGVQTALAALSPTPDHISRGHRRGFHVDALLRTAVTKAGDAVRDLDLVLSTAGPDDPNRDLIQAQIEVLR